MNCPTAEICHTSRVQERLIRGATWVFSFVMRVRSTGAVWDFTGASAELRIRRGNTSGAEVEHLTSAPAGGITLDSEAGRIRAVASTAGWETGKHVWTLQLTLADGTVLVPFEGEIQLAASALSAAP